MKDAIEPRGVTLQDFQLREVRMSDQIQKAIDAKVASQQKVEQLAYDYIASQKQADIARATASGVADAQQIINCGYEPQSVDSNGQQVTTLVPKTDNCNPITGEFLQHEYIQALQGLIASGNASTVIMPFDQSLTPLINLNGNSATGGTTAPDGSSSGATSNSTTPTTTAPRAGR